MKVVIIGAGLGGLACALACRREGIEVEVLERAEEITEVGAGIQIPPNGARVCRSLGILEQTLSTATVLETLDLRRYSSGRVLHERKLGKAAISRYDSPWLVTHRADYQAILLESAVAAGASVRLGAEMVEIGFEETRVILSDGTIFSGDVIVGADGLWSLARDKLLGRASPPLETGDLAYRGIFTKAQLMSLKDTEVEKLCAKQSVTIWLGPDKHAVFYPIKSGALYNFALLRPDNLPASTRTERGCLEEMRATFEDWDPSLQKLISCLPSVMKWKLCSHECLETWVRGNVCLLGDACHPTLPYQAQGAAMAVEDGAVLGKLLGLLNSSTSHVLRPTNNQVTAKQISEILKFYEHLRKGRTTTIVAGALENRKMHHMPDGPSQRQRDEALARADWHTPSEVHWADPHAQMELLGFDAVRNAEDAFKATFGRRTRTTLTRYLYL